VLPLGAPAGPQIQLAFRDAELVFDPREAYGDKGAGSGKM
jgi:hypothetical protein